nr:TonB-dependent siderophore receptor [Rhodoferax sp. OV413]
MPSASGTTTLPAVVVTAKFEADSTATLQQEGTAADGYRVETISSVGALGSMSLQDTPFSMSVVPRELIENIQAQSPDDVYKLNPSTLSHVPQASSYAPMVKIRGFNIYDRAEDGLRRSYGMAASMEDKERVEVLNGPSGFLFGAASPGGMVNYVSKRPTQERMNSVTLGNYGGSQAFVHGDFGGQFDADGRVGYRVNLVRQDGKTTVDDQKIDRTLASLALDFKVNNRLKLELDASYSDYGMQAPTQYWLFREGVPRITPDSSKNWGQPWTQDQIISRKWTTKAIFEASDNLTLRLAYLHDDQDRPKQDHTLNSVRSATEYYQLRQKVGPQRTESEAWQALADLSFDTGSVGHKLTLGYFGFSEKQWQSSYVPNTGYLGPNAFSAPTHVPEPNWPAMSANAQYYGGNASNHNLVIGDMLRFNDQWSVLAGINRSTIKGSSLDASGGALQPDYDKSRNSPNASLIFKPIPSLTTYATYIEGLEQGGVAPSTASNSLAIMPPMQSKQKELGVKAELGGMLVSGALFDIEKAYEYNNANNVYSQDGKQRHRGGEVSAIGKLTSAWTVMSGVTMLTPKIAGGTNDGKEPLNVPKLVAKLYSEYALPFAPGLSLTGGVYHVGKRWATASNTTRLPSYVTVDLGLRYATKVSGRPVTLRATVNNVADRDYWLSSYYLGTPRSLAFSAQLQF